MPTVDFYLIKHQNRQAFACKLIEKAWRSGGKIFVITETTHQTSLLDNLLWTFRAGSFIPHQVFTGELPKRNNIILMSNHHIPDQWADVMVNLGEPCPNVEAGRVLEILDENQAVKQAGRKRYRQYRDQGYTLNTHQVN